MIANAKVTASMMSCALLLIASAGHAQGPFDPGRNANKDLNAAKIRAAAEHKRILLDFGANWCAPCVTLDHLFNGDPAINHSLRAGYILVTIPISLQEDSAFTASIRRRYPKFSIVPHLLVIDADGKMLWDQPVAPLLNVPKEALSWNHRAVLAFLDRWSYRQ